MTKEEERMLAAIAWMAAQYLEDDGVLDQVCMSAGEQAMEVLADYGLVDTKDRGAIWTKKGKAFLASH